MMPEIYPATYPLMENPALYEDSLRREFPCHAMSPHTRIAFADGKQSVLAWKDDRPYLTVAGRGSRITGMIGVSSATRA